MHADKSKSIGGIGVDSGSAFGACDLPDAAPLCAVCDSPHGFQWTDTHGVGVCWKCAAPYTIFHYEDGQRIDNPPTIALAPTGVALAQRYWTETGRKVFPGAFDMGILGHRESTYSGATQDDMSAFEEWYGQQPEAIAARAAEAA